MFQVLSSTMSVLLQNSYQGREEVVKEVGVAGFGAWVAAPRGDPGVAALSLSLQNWEMPEHQAWPSTGRWGGVRTTRNALP